MREVEEMGRIWMVRKRPKDGLRRAGAGESIKHQPQEGGEPTRAPEGTYVENGEA